MMELLAIGAAGKALQSVTNLVHELKTPRLTKKDFATLLQEQVQKAQTEKMDPKRAESTTRAAIRRLDADNNGVLNMSESGLKQDMFNRLDLNKDGQLNSEELQQYFSNVKKA